jgi:hypothetical protein
MSGASPRGRPRGHALKPWHLLDRYVEWDLAEFGRRNFYERRKSKFFRDMHVGRSFATGQTLLDEYGLPWPLVPTYDELNRPMLVYLIYGRPPWHVLWISPNVREHLGKRPDEVLERPAIDVLRGGEDLRVQEPDHVQLAEALQRGELKYGEVSHSHLVHADRRWLPVDLRLSYGEASETFYCQATVTAPLRQPSEYVDAETGWTVRQAVLNLEPYFNAREYDGPNGHVGYPELVGRH